MIDDMDFSAKPPPAIASERVLHYAFLDDSVGFNAGHKLIFIDGKQLGKVPRLAICQAKKTSELSLFYCDDDWDIVGVSVHDSVPAAKHRAERIYPGSSGKWVEANFTPEEVGLYLDQVWASSRCSFCGKTPDEDLKAMFEANNARICDSCVVEFYRELREALDEEG